MRFPLLCLLSATLAHSGEAGDHPGDGWASFAGDGGFAVAASGLRLVPKGSAARLAWRHDEHMGVQKTNHAAPDQFYGGTATVIIGQGLVFTTWIRPAGEVRDTTSKNRYYDLTQGTPRMGLIDADDVAVAVDAETGRLRWRAEEAGASLNLLFGKRGHYGVSPAYGDGRFFAWGGIGIVYAYDAATGKKLWQTAVEPFHGKAAAAKAKSLAERRLIDTYGRDPIFTDLKTGLVAAGGVVAAPDGSGGLVGLDATTGQVRWTVKDVIARGATPGIWRKDGTPYLLCPTGAKTEGRVTLLDPASGKALWEQRLGGPNHTSLVVGDGDIVLMNTRGNLQGGASGPQGDAKAETGLFGGYRLTTTGAEPLWVLEDTPENWHGIRPDRGMNRRVAIRGPTAYVLLGVAAGSQRVATIDLATGKVLRRTAETFPSTACSPLIIEDRLIFGRDLCHAWESIAYDMFTIGADGALTAHSDIDVYKSLKVDVVTDYEVANEAACWRGRIFMKALNGLVAIDLRQR
jgi:outer membrane protein assembly factor BamB